MTSASIRPSSCCPRCLKKFTHQRILILSRFLQLVQITHLCFKDFVCLSLGGGAGAACAGFRHRWGAHSFIRLAAPENCVWGGRCGLVRKHQFPFLMQSPLEITRTHAEPSAHSDVCAAWGHVGVLTGDRGTGGRGTGSRGCPASLTSWKQALLAPSSACEST